MGQSGPEPESDLDRVAGVVVLLFWSVVLIEILGITIIVGVSEVQPRDAALIMIGPALLVWILASTRRPLRRAALYFFPPIP